MLDGSGIMESSNGLVFNILWRLGNRNGMLGRFCTFSAWNHHGMDHTSLQSEAHPSCHVKAMNNSHPWLKRQFLSLLFYFGGPWCCLHFYVASLAMNHTVESLDQSVAQRTSMATSCEPWQLFFKARKGCTFPPSFFKWSLEGEEVWGRKENRALNGEWQVIMIQVFVKCLQLTTWYCVVIMADSP